MQQETIIKKWVVSKIDGCKIRPFYCRLQKKKVYKRRQQLELQKGLRTLSKQI